jgi:hypothetical protein
MLNFRINHSTSLLMKLGAAVIEDSTSETSLPFALPMNESIKLSPSSSNSERTLFKAYYVLTFSGTISSSIFFAFLGVFVFSVLTTASTFLGCSFVGTTAFF